MESKACCQPGCTYTPTQAIIETEHDKEHDNLYAVAGLILKSKEERKESQESRESQERVKVEVNGILEFTRGGRIDTYQRDGIRFYGAEFDLLSLHVPWTPNKNHWVNLAQTYFVATAPTLQTEAHTVPKTFCRFCKKGEKELPNKLCQFCRVQWMRGKGYRRGRRKKGKTRLQAMVQ